LITALTAPLVPNTILELSVLNKWIPVNEYGDPEFVCLHPTNPLFVPDVVKFIPAEYVTSVLPTYNWKERLFQFLRSFPSVVLLMYSDLP